MKYLLDDRIFEFILNIIKEIKGLRQSDPVKLRLFIEAIHYMLRSGCQWRLVPEDYGNFRAIHKRFKRRADKGIWQLIFESSKIDPDMELIMLDATIVRAHACAAGYEKDSQEEQALGRSIGEFTAKIHCVCDALGLPLKFVVTPRQRHDIIQASEITKEYAGIPVLGDKGYYSHAFMDELIE